MNRAKQMLPAAAAMMALACLMSACERARQSEPVLPVVSTMKPTIQDVDVERDFVGQIRAVDEAEIRSKVTGRILSVQFREGQLVKQGQALFKIDSDSLREQVREAEAQVNNAMASLNKAKTDVARYKPLVEQGTISRQQFDTAVAAERQAQAQYEGAKAALASASIMEREAALVSPYNGRIGRALVKEGALVSAGETLLATVSTTEAMQVDFALSESEYLQYVVPYLKRLPVGQRPPVPAQLLLNDGSLYDQPGMLTFSDRALSAETGTFALSATFANPSEVLRPGMFGRVRMVVQRAQDAMLIPHKAVQPVLDKTFVSVVGADNLVARKAVSLGAVVGENVIVINGLDATDQVIVEGHHKARQGSKVEVKPYQPITAEPATEAAGNSASGQPSVTAG